jgi:hypothetical protein
MFHGQNSAPGVKEPVVPRRYRVGMTRRRRVSLQRISGEITRADKDFNLTQPHTFTA